MKKPDTYKYTTPPVRPTREPWLLNVGKFLACALVALMVGILLPLFLIEWMAGCGETYTDSTGKVHAYECIFISTNNPTN